MKPLSRLVAMIRALFRRDAVAGEIHDELEFHLEARVAQYQREGLSPDDARRKARRRVGNIAVHQERGYDIRGGEVLETIVQDVRYGTRLLIRQPSFSLIAIATLALGIGASTAVVSVIDAAVLRPLPYPHPEQLVEILTETDFGGGNRASQTRRATGRPHGGATAWALSSVLATQLFEMSATDARVYSGVAIFVATIAAIAALPPLRRAVKVEPLTALRE